MINIKCKSIKHSLFPDDMDIVVSMANGKPRSMTVHAKLIDEANQTVKAKLLHVAPDRYETLHVHVDSFKGKELFYIRNEVTEQ